MDRLPGTESPWKRLTTEYIYQNPWFAIRHDHVRTHVGKEITYTFMEHPGAVAVVPITHEGNIVLIRSFRYAVQDWCWEIPMGGRDHKDLEVVARKELIEEVGGVCQQLIYINNFYANNGVSNIRCDVFLAQGVELAVSQPEDTELIEIKVFPKDVVFGMARAGEITDGMSALSLFLCEGYL